MKCTLVFVVEVFPYVFLYPDLIQPGEFYVHPNFQSAPTASRLKLSMQKINGTVSYELLK